MIATMVGDGYGCGERKDDEADWGWPGRLGSATDVCGTTTKESILVVSEGSTQSE